MSYYRNHSTDGPRKPRITIDPSKVAHVERKNGQWVVIGAGEVVATAASAAEAMQAMIAWNRTQQEGQA